MAHTALAARTGRPARRACRATRARQALRACAARPATTAWQVSCHAVTDGRAVHSGQTTAPWASVSALQRVASSASNVSAARLRDSVPQCITTIRTAALHCGHSLHRAAWLAPPVQRLDDSAHGTGQQALVWFCCRAGWHARQDRPKGSRRYDRQRQRLQQTRASCNVFVQQAARHVSCTVSCAVSCAVVRPSLWHSQSQAVL